MVEEGWDSTLRAAMPYDDDLARDGVDLDKVRYVRRLVLCLLQYKLAGTAW